MTTLIERARTEAERVPKLTGAKWSTAERFQLRQLLLDLAAALQRQAPTGKAPRLEAPEAVIVARLGELAAAQPPGALLGTRDLRQHVPELDKATFDAAVLALASRRAIALHHTDLPGAMLSDEQRAAYVYDKATGVYYIGIAPLRAGPARRGQDDDLGAFAQRVLAAARRSPTGWWGERKVFISHVWEEYQRRERKGGRQAGDLEAFKLLLVRANRASLLSLSRADLVEAMDKDDVKRSEIASLGTTFHFLRI
jgi:hypothetical protein